MANPKVRLCKPSSVPALRRSGDHFSGPAVADWLSREREATYPPAERPWPFAPGPSAAYADRLLGLAGGGVFPAGDVAAAAVRSYRTISPLPEPRKAIGCVFSVALSLGLLPVAVSHHRALPCSDFPLHVARGNAERPPEPPLGIYSGLFYHIRLDFARL